MSPTKQTSKTPQRPPKANDELWARLTVSQHRHRKFRGLDLDATGLWTLGLSWAADNKTDGLIPEDEVRHLSTARPARVRRAAAALVARNLWEKVPGFYRIVNFADYNATAAYLESRREAGRKAAEIRWRPDAVRNADANAERNAGVDVGVGKEEKPSPPTPPKALAPPKFFKDKAAEKAQGQAKAHTTTTMTSEQAIREEQKRRARITDIAGPCRICGATTGPHDIQAHRQWGKPTAA